MKGKVTCIAYPEHSRERPQTHPEGGARKESWFKKKGLKR